MIPLTRPVLGDEESRAVAEVLETGMLVQGARVERFESRLAERTHRAEAVAVSSGTSALELALRALGVGPGDEVLCPALTWPSPAHAVALVGASPVLVDVDAREWNATAEALAGARTERTRAAIVIDQFGFPARHGDIEAALADLPVIEDAACGLGASLAGRPLGAMGRIACLSFHPRKVITTGEGGACLTDDPALAARLRILRNHGQHAPGYFVEPAGNHRMTEMAAAMGMVQLDRLDAIVEERRVRAARYREALPELGWQAPAEGAEPNWQTMGLVLADTVDRDTTLSALRAEGIGAGLLSYALSRIGSLREGRSCPEAERIADRGIAVPLFPGMGDEAQNRVIGALRAILAPR